jgi:phosphopantetheine--protein transferase-like protein
MSMAVSIAHTAGFGVAVVLPAESDAVGIDVEAIGAVTEAVAAASFTPEELALVEGLAGTRRAWLTRFWCAKEAVAKAEGTGLAGRPGDFVVAGVTDETVTVTAQERTYRVATDIVEDSHAVAWTTPEITQEATP